MSKKISCCAAAVVAALFVAQPTFAQQSAPRVSEPAVAQPGAPSAADGQRGAAATPASAAQPGAASMDKNQMFVEKAAQGGMYEVAAARVAQERAQSPETKELAKMIETDHQKANQQLMQIAQSKSLTVPKELDAVHQAKLAELSKKQGKDFDMAYQVDQVAGHVAMSLKFRHFSQELQDPELKQFATTTLQSINQHGQHAAKVAGWTGFESREAIPASSTERGTGTSSPATPARSTGSGAGSDATNGQKTGDRGAVGPSSVGDTSAPK